MAEATSAARAIAAPPAVQVVDDPQAFGALDAAGPACIAWRRRLPASLAGWIDGLTFTMPRQGRWQLEAGQPAAPCVRQWLAGWLAGVATPDPRWVADLALLLDVARAHSGGKPLAVRLDVVANDACRLFHVDRLRVRWICTYRGPATQWLPDDAVDRHRLGRGNNDHVRDWGRVGQLAPHWFAAMRGDLWPGAEGRGFVHRSPPASTLAPRIVLAIDTV
jgi:hypothetical protein